MPFNARCAERSIHWPSFQLSLPADDEGMPFGGILPLCSGKRFRDRRSPPFTQRNLVGFRTAALFKMKPFLNFLAAAGITLGASVLSAQSVSNSFTVMAFYTAREEPAHISFVHEANP